MTVLSNVWGMLNSLSKLITLLLLFTVSTNLAQDGFCADFRTGNFYIPPTESLPISYSVVRTNDAQVETVQKAAKGLLSEQAEAPQYGVLKWIDDCSYRIWFDDNKGPLSEVQQMINRNNGVLIEFLSVEGNCVNFRSTLEKQDEIVTFLGQQCKE